MKDREIFVHVQPCTYSDRIYILIPPKFWGKPRIAEGIEAAVNLTFLEGHKGIHPNGEYSWDELKELNAQKEKD